MMRRAGCAGAGHSCVVAMRWGLLLVVAVLGACAAPLAGLVNPDTGQTQTCTSHLPPGFASLEMDRCLSKARLAGFVKAEELTAEQQAAIDARVRGRQASRAAQASGGGESGADEASADQGGRPPGSWRRVTMVPDAQTIVLDGGETLQYLGIRPLESFQAPTAAARFGEAVAFNRQLVEGQAVRLEFDPQARDSEGRHSAYVYLLDGRMVNAQLVQNGYAQADPDQPNLQYAQLFMQLEASARAARRGFWGVR